MSREEYHWFMDHGPKLRPHCTMGSDYYVTNEKKVMNAKGEIQLTGEVLGYYEIAKQYFDRYTLPIFHTETNRKDDLDAPRWLWKEWFNILRLKRDGIPILGFTWYSLLDQTDWDVVLREDNERINPMGLYDLERKIRPVGQAFRELIAAWDNHLPMESLSRDMSSEFSKSQSASRGQEKPAKDHDGKPAVRPEQVSRNRHPVREHPPKPRNRKVLKSSG
jgi:hypothetical protein